MIKKVLWVSGFLAAIAILVRGAVVLGLFLGILPGLTLAVAPTIFLYTAAFALIRRSLRSRLPTRRASLVNTAAALLTAAAGVAVTAPLALHGRRALAAASKDPVTPGAPVPIEGDVRLDRAGQAWSLGFRTKKDTCDALCAALLDTPGVRSVTIGGSESSGTSISPVTYRLIPKDRAQGPTLIPVEPSSIVDHLPDPEVPAQPARPRWEAVMAAKKALKHALTARWSLRLATGQSLVGGPVPPAFDRTVSIRQVRGEGLHRIGMTELEITDRSGQVMLRHHRLTAEPIAMPFHLTPGGPMLDRGFEIGRSAIHTGPRYFDFKPVETLFRETSLSRPAADERLVPELRGRLAAAAGSSRSAEAAVMAGPWLATLDWQHLADADVDVLARLIADPHMTGLERIYDGYATHVSPRLRRPIAVRLLDPSTDDRLRSTLNTLVRKMPEGTYRELLPEEKGLLADRALRLRSSALVARLADQGRSAVPMLLDLLAQSVDEDEWKKRHILDDIRRAFSRLGREASAALPAVERLLEMRHSPLTNTSSDVEDWRVAMVRMGKPVESLTFRSDLKPEIVARDRERIRKRAEKGPEF